MKITMNNAVFILAVVWLVWFAEYVQCSNKFKMFNRPHFSRGERAEPDHQHDITIAVKQYNVNVLHNLLVARSTPGDPYYQQWLTDEEIADMTYNQNAVLQITDWLTENNVTIKSMSKNSEYIYAKASIKIWERMLRTSFSIWQDSQDPDHIKTYHRAESYTIPSHMTPYIYSMFKTCQAPPIIGTKVEFIGHRQLGLTPVDVAFLNNLYGVGENIVSSSMHQAVAATYTGVQQTFNQNDLTMHQTANGITPLQAIPVGITPVTTCNSNCGEGNLDLQTLMGMSQGATTTYYYSDGSISDPFIEILTQIGALPVNQRPTVLSISYGGNENSYPADLMNTFNTEALKLAAQGLTILVSSGDNGASGFPGQCNTVSSSSATQWKGTTTWTGTGYLPSYPATSPYVTSVGATMGPERGNPEITSQTSSSTSATTTGVFNGMSPITSGGGFSSYNPTPTWQQAAVTSYLNANPSLAPGFNRNGRGFPDISYIGVYYHIYVNGAVKQMYGTSASAPLAAGIINLINARRLAGGYTSTVGFINPTLYANPSKFNDITSGSNYCASYQGGSTPITCCNAGFPAGPGWDPVTGLGSINFWNLISILAPNVPTPAPTSQPTLAPTNKPTVSPTKSPTNSPTKKPTNRPTMKPTKKPTLAPTKKPTSQPTLKPTFAPTNYAQSIFYKCSRLPKLANSLTKTLWYANVNFTQLIFNATLSDLDNISGIPSLEGALNCAMHTSNFNNVINTVDTQYIDAYDSSFRRLTSLQDKPLISEHTSDKKYSSRLKDRFHPDLFIQAPTPTISVLYTVTFQFLVDNTGNPTTVMNTQANNLNKLLGTNINNGIMLALLKQLCSTSAGGCFNTVSNFSYPAMSTPILVPQTIVAAKGKYNIGLIVGASFGVICGLCIIIILVMSFYRHKAANVFEANSTRSVNTTEASAAAAVVGNAQYGGSENNSAFDNTSDRPSMSEGSQRGEGVSSRRIDVDSNTVDTTQNNQNTNNRSNFLAYIRDRSIFTSRTNTTHNAPIIHTSPLQEQSDVNPSPQQPVDTIYYVDESLNEQSGTIDTTGIHDQAEVRDDEYITGLGASSYGYKTNEIDDELLDDNVSTSLKSTTYSPRLQFGSSSKSKLE